MKMIFKGLSKTALTVPHSSILSVTAERLRSGKTLGARRSYLNKYSAGVMIGI